MQQLSLSRPDSSRMILIPVQPTMRPLLSLQAATGHSVDSPDLRVVNFHSDCLRVAVVGSHRIPLFVSTRAACSPMRVVATNPILTGDKRERKQGDVRGRCDGRRRLKMRNGEKELRRVRDRVLKPSAERGRRESRDARKFGETTKYDENKSTENRHLPDRGNIPSQSTGRCWSREGR